MDSGAWWATVHGVSKELDLATKTTFIKYFIYTRAQYSVLAFMSLFLPTIFEIDTMISTYFSDE